VRRADYSSRGVLPSVVSLSVVHEAPIMRRFWPTGVFRAIKKENMQAYRAIDNVSGWQNFKMCLLHTVIIIIQLHAAAF